ncbi:hypothetical protein Rhsp01_62750 [Rhizobium sp. NBRC 114257]|nr:hypothetical protein Rhsp01_62750 [Rhizobium sp. NBRC 114257]
MVGERPAQRGRLQRPAALDEQRFAEPLFQHAKGTRHRRLREPQQGRSLRDATGLYDGCKLYQVSFIHLHSNKVY